MADPPTEESGSSIAVLPAREPAHRSVHLTWLRCPRCRRPLVPLYVAQGRTVLEPTPHVQVMAARITCPADGSVLEWESDLRAKSQIPEEHVSC